MKHYDFEIDRPVVKKTHADFMCPASDDSCCSIADGNLVVQDGIVLCGKPADVVRVHHTLPRSYLPQCRYCYYQSRTRGDPSLSELRKSWGKDKVEV